MLIDNVDANAYVNAHSNVNAYDHTDANAQ